MPKGVYDRVPGARIGQGKGRKLSEEHRCNISAAQTGKSHPRKGQPISIETRQKISQAQRGRRSRGGEADGYLITPQGYVALTGKQEHPLSTKKGQVLEHRFVLYEMVGPGEHPCHWCGRMLNWDGKGNRSTSIRADHLNGDRRNNSPENLVVSCHRCNIARGYAGDPIDWSPAWSVIPAS